MTYTREQLLHEARARGRRWGEYRYRAFGGYVGHSWPSMLDPVTNRDAHKNVADIVPLDVTGEAMVQACYEAARFYARTFPDSTVGAVHRAPSDFPGGKAGDGLTVEFTVCGVSCFGLNGGDVFKHSEAFSFQNACAGV